MTEIICNILNLFEHTYIWIISKINKHIAIYISRALKTNYWTKNIENILKSSQLHSKKI